MARIHCHGNAGVRKSARHRKFLSERCRAYQDRVKRALALLAAREQGLL